jgi:hypothetical protein
MNIRIQNIAQYKKEGQRLNLNQALIRLLPFHDINSSQIEAILENIVI